MDPGSGVSKWGGRKQFIYGIAVRERWGNLEKLCSRWRDMASRLLGRRLAET